MIAVQRNFGSVRIALSKNIAIASLAAERHNRQTIGAFFFVFVAALALRLWFNFVGDHPNVTFAEDGAEYLRIAQGLNLVSHLPAQFWASTIKTLFSAGSSPESLNIQQQLSALSEMQRGGLCFPAYLLFAFTIGGATPSVVNWATPVAFQSAISAASAVLIAATALTVWNRKTAITAGVIAALYPGFVINSGRMCSETFAVFLICCSLFCCVRLAKSERRSAFSCFTLGVCASALQLTRSLFAIMPIVLLPIILLPGFRRNKTRGLIPFLLGLCLLYAPWMYIEKCAFGNASLVINRSGAYNLFIGNNTSTLGWLTFPSPDLTGVESSSPEKILSKSIKANPAKWVQLFLDKAPRLFALPWNDYKTSIGPLNATGQSILHQLILLFAAVGVVTALLENKSHPNKQEEFGRINILVIFGVHLIYLCFISMARYAVTAMPCVILFASAGIACTTNLPWTREQRNISIKLAIAIIAFFALMHIDLMNAPADIFQRIQLTILHSLQGAFRTIAFAALIFFSWRTSILIQSPRRAASLLALVLFVTTAPSIALPLRAYGRYGEWCEDFTDPGQKYFNVISINQHQSEMMLHRQSFVIFNVANGECLSDDTEVEINGVKLSGAFIPAMSLAQNLSKLVQLDAGTIRPEAEYIINDITSGFNKQSLLCLRDTYLVPIDGAEIDAALSRIAGSNAKLFIQLTKTKSRSNRIYGGTPNNSTSHPGLSCLTMPSVHQFSWEKGNYAVEDPETSGDYALDTRICFQPPQDQAMFSVITGGAEPEGSNRLNPYLRILVSPEKANAPMLMEQIADYRLASNARAPGSEILAACAVNCDRERRKLDAKLKSKSKIDQHSTEQNPATIELIRVTADVHNGTTEDKLTTNLHVLVHRAEGSDLIYPAAWLPKKLTPQGTITHLDYAYPMAIPTEVGEIKQLSMSVKEEITKSVNAPPIISEIRIRRYRLPVNPVGTGFQIL